MFPTVAARRRMRASRSHCHAERCSQHAGFLVGVALLLLAHRALRGAREQAERTGRELHPRSKDAAPAPVVLLARGAWALVPPSGSSLVAVSARDAGLLV